MSDDLMIAVVGNQNTNLNAQQIEEGRCFLSQIFGNFCGANADEGKGCGKTVEDLETVWKSEYLKRNEKPPTRKQPFLFINEKQGNGLHRREYGKFVYCGNICYYCKSCNMLFDRKQGDIKPDEKATFQARKSHEVRPKFVNLLEDHLAKFEHLCFKAVINKWSGMNEFRCSQETLENAFYQFFDIKFDFVATLEYGIDCKYKKCDGNHIILKDHPPIPQKRDIEAFRNEQSRDL